MGSASRWTTARRVTLARSSWRRARSRCGWRWSATRGRAFTLGGSPHLPVLPPAALGGPWVRCPRCQPRGGVCTKRDRLARSTHHLVALAKESEAHGVDLIVL